MRQVLVAMLGLLAFAAQAATVESWPLPAPPGSAQPNLVDAPDGSLLLSWIERDGGGHRLRFARQHRAGAWTPPATIAAGDDWFVNWADFPSLQVLGNGQIYAHVLVQNADAAYAYDTRLFRSRDGGAHWRALGAVHDDGTPTEHGFATLWAQGDRLGIAWLDGRRSGGGHGDHAGHGGAMTLRAATWAGGRKRAEHELDARTCDCCQTDSAVDGDTVLLAWRDRAPGEIRDIVVARQHGGRWQAPAPVHADGWEMPACPVNGPAIAARAGEAWVAWYTAPGGEPQLRLAHSRDGGRRFAAPRVVARGERQQGRVDLAADADGVWMSWLEEGGDGQSLWLARFDRGLATETLRLKVADVVGRGRGTGFPRLRLRDGAAWLVWTELPGGEPRLRGARVLP